jgi:hypothetical protein
MGQRKIMELNSVHTQNNTMFKKLPFYFII